MTAYNAITPVEADAVERLIKNVQSRPGGRRLDTVMWAASGSEAIQKALWACLHRDETRDVVLATRYGFHGKKGLAGAVTGSETDHDRDPRVRFIVLSDGGSRRCVEVRRDVRRVPRIRRSLTRCGKSWVRGSTASSPSPTWAAAAAIIPRRRI